MTTIRRGLHKSMSLPAWKFEAPRLAEHLITREHLVEKIEQQIGKKRSSGDVFLVSAPAGYGKTTLLAQWAAASSVPVAWYHLDGSDDDPVVFILGLVRALREAMPSHNRSRGQWMVKELLDNLHCGTLSPVDLRRATTLLIDDIQRNITRPLALILTSLAEIKVGGSTHSVLDSLLARQPDHLRVILETREAPRLRVSALLTQRRLDGVGADDLRLRDDELTALLSVIGKPLDSNRMEMLRSLCAGWITGVLLATGALLPAFLPTAATEFDRERVFDYLACEVIETLPPSLCEFATEAAVLSYMTPTLCANLLELPTAREKLVELEKRTGFVTRAGRRPEEPVYHVQPLLRQALLERLEQGPDGPARRRELHERAGLLLEAVDEHDEAVQQYAQAGCYERVIAVIEANRGMLLRAGRGATLTRWLDLLPHAVCESRPELEILLADIHRQAGRLAEAEAAARRACDIVLPRSKSDPLLAARALVVRAHIASPLGHFADVCRDCEAALRLAPDDADEIRIQAGFLLASAMQALNGPTAAWQYLEGLEERCTRQRDLWTLARLNYLRSRLLIAQGAYAQAEKMASAALLTAQEAGDEIDSIIIRLNLGYIKWRTNQPAAARQHFEIAYTLAESAGDTLYKAYAVANLGDLEVAVGDFAQATSTYERAVTIATSAGDTHLRDYALANLGYAMTLDGQPQQAAALLAPELTRSRDAGHEVDWVTLAIVLGLAYVRDSVATEAIPLLREACARAHACGGVNEYVQAELHLAAAYAALHDGALAIEALHTALDTAERADGVTMLLTEVRHLPEVASIIAESPHPLAEAFRQHIQDLEGQGHEPVDQQGRSPDTLSHVEDEPVRVFALGEARIFVGTERITRWRKPLSRELLLFLLDQGEPVHKETILETFWPDKDPEQSESAFRQVRFWLKQSLGRECLAQQEGRWRLTIECWHDVREFERLVDDGERLFHEGKLSQAAVTLRQAHTYWTGHYLEDIYSDWAILRRDALSRRYLMSLERLADIETQLGHHDEAVQLYYQILEAEPHRETAHRALMRHFDQRGEPAEAIHQFARCHNILKRELGILPSRETNSLYRSIRAKLLTPRATSVR
ncbi:MAG TPA: BTAD domain-containing putative transcriptional regulator [Ktedonobacterales bacterium]|nr:BTAD domain-containing putative transcriptional regulator [Ktedonobacterales bacterium]